MLLKLLGNALRRRAPAGGAALLARGEQHYARGEYEAAEASFREAALGGAPAAWRNLAALLVRRRSYAAALPVLARVLEDEPDLAEAHLDLGTCHLRLGDDAAAIRYLERALALKPALDAAHANVLDAYLSACDWDAVERWRESFLEYRRTHAPQEWARRLYPLAALSLFGPEITRPLAIERARETARAAGAHAPPALRPHADGRIRVGYVSSDFNDHALGHLTHALYGAHDRAAFEIVAYSTGASDDSAYQRHIRAACDRFVEVADESAERIAERVRVDGIHILVDMNGYSAGSRRDVFARRAAPIQVNYLGYPGTSGAEYMDYFVTDTVATPHGFEHEFTESLVRLPDTYQANHRESRIGEPGARGEWNLPQDAFVFCCFNTLRKIDPAVFASWMAILGQTPGSVLWLVKGGEAAQSNLRAAAARAGVDPVRLVFAPNAERSRYLARYRHADLFLDTYAYNAHTTGSDALWIGLPVLTCPGDHFAARVGASLLTACGMPELIAPAREDYVASAVRLAREPDALKAIAAKLSTNRLTCALFDTARYVQHLEAAYRRMYGLAAERRPPESLAIPRGR